MFRCFCFIALIAICAGADAHDTWLVPEPPSAAHGYWTVQLTTGDEFPALGSAANPATIDRADLITGSHRVPLLLLPASANVLPFRVVADASDVSVAVVAERANRVELAPELVEKYVHDEFDGDAQLLARYRAQGRWRESYGKNAKLLIRTSGDAPAAIATRPQGLAYELVPEVDPTLVAAGEPYRVCAYAHGRRVRARVYVGLVDVDGRSTLRRADRRGCVRVRPATSDGYLLHSILIGPVDSGDVDWESQFASLTVHRATASPSPTRSEP